MDLAAQIRMFVPWHWGVLRDLVAHAGRSVLWAIACKAGAQFAQMLALFLPLKILILLGSDGVPKYFRAFMTGDLVGFWVAGLTIATISLYAISVVLIAMSRRGIGRGTDALFVPSKREGTDPRNERRQFHRTVERLYDSYADAAIAAVAWLGILILHPVVACAIALTLALQCAGTQWILNHPGTQTVAWLRRRIRGGAHEYIRSMGDIGFLAVFGFLLIDYFVRGELNVIFAVLTLLLGRRMYPAVARYVQKALSFSGREMEVRERLFGDTRVANR